MRLICLFLIYLHVLCICLSSPCYAESYSRLDLLQLGCTLLSKDSSTGIDSQVYRSIKDLGILNQNVQTKRGNRGGRKVKSKFKSTSSNLQNPLGQSSVTHALKFGLLNARSVNEKENLIADHIIENNLDVVALTETWLGPQGSNPVLEGDLCPPGYSLALQSRTTRGGGIALIYRSTLKCSILQSDNFQSFENLEIKLYNQTSPIHMIIIYRPGPNVKNKLTSSMFFNEFTPFLEEKSLSNNRLCIVGDFNFHLDDKKNSDAKRFARILSSFDLYQHVDCPTHEKGHTLDLVISRPSDELLCDLNVEESRMGKCDHHWIHCLLRGPKPKTLQKQISYRKIKSIDLAQFSNDLQNSDLFLNNTFDTLENAVSVYNSTLENALNSHAPVISKTITIHSDAPWYNDDIAEAKREKRRAEKLWRKTKLTVHREIYVEKRDTVNRKMQEAKTSYYSNLVSEADDHKDLFKIIDKLCHKKNDNILPEHKSSKELANRFAEFFTNKIVNIRKHLESITSQNHENPTENNQTSKLETLEPTSPEELKKIIMKSKATTCDLDPIPTSLLKHILDLILPVMTKIINMSFENGTVPKQFKKALILPLLKKILLDPEILKNFRPVSNLSFLSKLMERVAANRLLNHMSLNNLHVLFQSSYKQFHSTETALLRIHSDILSALDNKKCVLLVLLDLSAAFDTIDHPTLFSRLANAIGLSGKALQWFVSYLTDRTQSVIINGVESETWNLLFGVPQGSVLGPILFIIYTSPLAKILESLGVMYHFYADDTQLYITFDINETEEATSKMEHAVSVIRTWMADNFLCLNDDKTEVLLIGSKSSHEKLDIPHIQIGNEKIEPSSSAKNIGFRFDSVLNGKKQVKDMCKSAWHHLRTIGKIRRYLDSKATELLVHAFITSKLDINNALLYGLPDSLIHSLQVIQNSAARLVMKLPKTSHVTPILIQLHWLPVQFRIKFKILLFVYKSLNGLAPGYVLNMLQHKPVSSYALRSDKKHLLMEPKSKTATYGDRNFRNVAPRLWNLLPLKIKMAPSVNSFKTHLKTYLFKQAYELPV